MKARSLEAIRSLGSQSRNHASFAQFALRRGPLQIRRDLDRFPWLWALARANELHRALTCGRSGLYGEANAWVVHQIVEEILGWIASCLEAPEATVLHEDLVPPELLLGMGLRPWMMEMLGIVVPMIDPSIIEGLIDVAEIAGIPADLCSLPKSTVGLALSDQLPRAAAMISSNMPCDGGMSQYALIERHLGLPTFHLDIPYDFYSERAVSYFSSQLHELVAWLTDRTGHRMDWERLREVCEERNRAMEFELDLWDMLRQRPAPMAAETIYLSHMTWVIARPGTPRGTRVFETLSSMARRNVKRGVGALLDERYRFALWNPPTLCSIDLFNWAERSYGAALIMDMLTYHDHPFIDTSSPETMIRGLSKVIMRGPMARHTRGPAENFLGDLLRLHQLFDLDMLWVAGHIGCKNTRALFGILRERCRAQRIPLLVIDYDLSDTRVVPPDGIRRQVEQFMEVVMKAERSGA